MAIPDATLAGFDGEIDAILWARLNSIGERGYLADDDWMPSPISGQRRVVVGAGTNRQAGTLVTVPRAVQVDVPAPAAGTGRFYVLTGRRNWASKSFDYALVEGPATNTDVPSAPPLFLPSGVEKSPGAVLDCVIAWLWVSANQASVTVWDWRHDRPRPFVGRTAQGWGGLPPRFDRSLVSVVSGRVFVEQLITIDKNGIAVGPQVKRPYRAAPGLPAYTQEGRGATRRPGGHAYLFGMTSGADGTTQDEIRFDLMALGQAYVGQTNFTNSRPAPWAVGDYIYLKYDYVPLWPLAEAL